LISKINTMDVVSLNDFIRDIERTKKELDDAIKGLVEQSDASSRGAVDERGSVREQSGGAGVADVSHRLDELLESLFSRINARAERGGSQRISDALGESLQVRAQSAAGVADLRTGLAAVRRLGHARGSVGKSESAQGSGSGSSSGEGRGVLVNGKVDGQQRQDSLELPGQTLNQLIGKCSTL